MTTPPNTPAPAVSQAAKEAALEVLICQADPALSAAIVQKAIDAETARLVEERDAAHAAAVKCMAERDTARAHAVKLRKALNRLIDCAKENGLPPLLPRFILAQAALSATDADLASFEVCNKDELLLLRTDRDRIESLLDRSFTRREIDDGTSVLCMKDEQEQLRKDRERLEGLWAETTRKARNMLLLCRDYFAEDCPGRFMVPRMPSWAKMCHEEIKRIDAAMNKGATP